MDQIVYFIPLSAELNNFNFHSLVFVSRDPQIQVGDNYSYLFNLRPRLNKHFVPNNSDFIG